LIARNTSLIGSTHTHNLGLMAGNPEAVWQVYSQLYRRAVALGYFEDELALPMLE
jgi:hypothetical protein